MIDYDTSKFIDTICKGPDCHIDPQLKVMLQELKNKPLDKYKDSLHKAIDFAARASLASDFVMNVMIIEWERVGGKVGDPTPWREACDAKLAN